MNINDIVNDPELKRVLKEIENLPLEQGVKKLLPIIQRMNITPEQVQEMIAQGLSFQNPLGQQRLNPMYEARVVERVQFDGDAPELRTSAMPRGGTPAVPVDTENQNPALIGCELQKASDEVQESLNLLAEKSTELVSAELSEPLGYQRGQVPTPRKVQGTSILSMTHQEKKMNTWRFISTTQGRNSVVPNIERALLKVLREKGFQVEAQDSESWDMRYDWTTDISSGENSTPSNFDYVGLVVKVFEKTIVGSFEKNDLIFKVMSVNDISTRKVGWYISIKGRIK